MTISCSFYWNVFKQLLATDFSIFKETFKDKIIDLFIWVAITAAIMGYVMPAFGLAADYGAFQLAGLIASAGLFEVFPSMMNLVGDFEGDRVIDYHLTLPIPSKLVIIKIMTYYALNAMILSLCVIPMGKIILWNQFDLTKIAPFKMLVMIAITGIFYGAFTIWLASMLDNMARVGSLWMRFIFPLWFLGGFQFSWLVLYKLFPILAYINLLNPMMYIMEGNRAAVLGQAGYIPFWCSVGALIIFSLLAGYFGIRSLKKRLDFV